MRPDPAVLPLLRRLHQRVFEAPDLRAVLKEAFEGLAAELRRRAEPPHATCTLPIELFTGVRNHRTARQAHHRTARQAHDRIRLCRLFLLRRGKRMAMPERHANSVQRLVSYRGRGRIHQGRPGGSAFTLRARAIRSPQEGGEKRRVDGVDAGLAGLAPVAGNTDLACHWDIVPAGVWHYPEADGGEDWATVTFHSAAEDEIVDETLTGGDCAINQVYYRDR